MRGKIPLKHAFKWLVGRLAAVTNRCAAPSSGPGVAVLMYHRVARTGCFDWSLDDWNVVPGRFERQVAWLARHAEYLSLAQFDRLWQEPPGAKPRVLVTFDDGFANFASTALPVLEKYGVPATVFLVTGEVDIPGPYPFDRWGVRNQTRALREAWARLNWAQVEACARTGLVTFGSHSHTHPDPAAVQTERLGHEASRSREILRRRLGEEHAFAYAYPYGSTRLGYVTEAYVQALREAGFRLGFTTDPGIVQPESPPLMLPRLEVYRWDSPGVLAAKARGVLWPIRWMDRVCRASR